MDIADIATTTTHGAFSVRAIHTAPDDTETEVDVVLDFGIERMGGGGGGFAIHREDQADFMRAQVYPVRGGILEIIDDGSPHQGRKWELGDVVEDDGYVVTAVLRKEITT